VVLSRISCILQIFRGVSRQQSAPFPKKPKKTKCWAPGNTSSSRRRSITAPKRVVVVRNIPSNAAHSALSRKSRFSPNTFDNFHLRNAVPNSSCFFFFNAFRCAWKRPPHALQQTPGAAFCNRDSISGTIAPQVEKFPKVTMGPAEYCDQAASQDLLNIQTGKHSFAPASENAVLRSGGLSSIDQALTADRRNPRPRKRH